MVSSLWRNTAYRATKEHLYGAILLLRHFKWRASAMWKGHSDIVTLCRTRIHGVNPVYCCARADQPKRYAFAPRRKARR